MAGQPFFEVVGTLHLVVGSGSYWIGIRTQGKPSGLGPADVYRTRAIPESSPGIGLYLYKTGGPSPCGTDQSSWGGVRHNCLPSLCLHGTDDLAQKGRAPE